MRVIKASPEMKELASQVPIFIEDLRPVAEQPYVWAAPWSSGPEEKALLDYFDINVVRRQMIYWKVINSASSSRESHSKLNEMGC